MWTNVTAQCGVFGDGVHDDIGIGIQYREQSEWRGLMPLMSLHRDHYMGEKGYDRYRVRPMTYLDTNGVECAAFIIERNEPANSV